MKQAKQMKQKLFDEITGWVGTGLILTAYALGSFQVIEISSLAYQLMNLLGAIGVMYISFKKKTYQSGFLNLVWALIALISLTVLISKL
ncbi:MAG TPA: hypothetical protein PLK34_01215 [Candidatus Pacearchaeota archaeon]|nr:hypothetical protein [Candidatus Pacearchaeota archaeon]